MKTKKLELNVDYIGGEPLTQIEEQALSKFFQEKKLTSKKQTTKILKLSESKDRLSVKN